LRKKPKTFTYLTNILLFSCRFALLIFKNDSFQNLFQKVFFFVAVKNALTQKVTCHLQAVGLFPSSFSSY